MNMAGIPTHTASAKPMVSPAGKSRFRSGAVWLGLFAMLGWVLPLAIRLAVGPKHGAKVAIVATAVIALVIFAVLAFASRDDMRKQAADWAKHRHAEDMRRQTFKCVSPQEVGSAAGFPIKVRRAARSLAAAQDCCAEVVSVCRHPKSRCRAATRRRRASSGWTTTRRGSSSST